MLTRSRGTHDEDAMTNLEELFQLHHLKTKGIVGVVSESVTSHRHILLQGRIALARWIDPREQIPYIVCFIIENNNVRMEIPSNP